MYICKWWTKFLDNAEPLKLQASTKKVKTIESVVQYCETQIPRNLAIYREIFGISGVVELIANGQDRYKLDDKKIIEKLKRSK